MAKRALSTISTTWNLPITHGLAPTERAALNRHLPILCPTLSQLVFSCNYHLGIECVTGCYHPGAASSVTSSVEGAMLQIKKRFQWQVRDEIWDQEGSGPPTLLSVLGPQLEPLWKAKDGPLAAIFLLFTKCPEVCLLSDHF